MPNETQVSTPAPAQSRHGAAITEEEYEALLADMPSVR
jgi:hypothetical protein